MIKVCYPQGCYGNYLGQCLYYFTNLKTNDTENFGLDSRGSSHAFFNNTKARQHIRLGHFITDADNSWPNITVSSEDTLISIIPLADHQLDYYNNHFSKHYQGDLIKAISEAFTADEIKHKLSTQWGYTGDFGPQVPPWVLRELFSFCIGDILHNMYDQPTINNFIAVSTQDFFENFSSVFKSLCNKLNLTVTVDDNVIVDNNELFIGAQQYHNSQLVCERWIRSVITHKQSTMHQPTLFESAYIQFRLRQLGYEIQCDGLDVFPVNSQDLANIIFKI
jgi:hypothetical protein